MIVLPVESGPVATIGFLIYDEQTRDGVVIDAPLDSCNFFIRQVGENNIKLHAILLTHSHWDHTADCPKLKAETGADVYIFKEDEYRIISPMENTIWPLPFILERLHADKYLQDRDILRFGSLEIETLFTPGHTEGGACFVIHSEKTVFSGDTLFNMSIGRVDLPGGNYEQLITSINDKLMKLDDDYLVNPGHGEPTTVGFERRNNPFINNDLSINI